MTPIAARTIVGLVALCGAIAGPSAFAASSSADLVPGRPGVRALATSNLTAGTPVPAACLTPVVQSVRSDPQRASVLARRSVAGFASDVALSSERRTVDGDGNVVRFTLDRGSLDRVDQFDENANGRPDLVDATLSGLSRAQRLLVGQLELPNPGPVDVVLGRLGSGVEGVTVPGTGRNVRYQISLDPGAARNGAAGVRRAAEHQYAHAVAALAGLDPSWGEAFAAWCVLSIEGGPDDRSLGAIGLRLGSLGSGLVLDDLSLASGNAAWFAFLQESYGPTAVKLAVEELGRGGSDQAALDRALRRVTGDGIDAALREFQVWSLLVGPRDDGRHFSFASKLQAPVFASTTDTLPALSVQADPDVAPMGSAMTLLNPGERTGGLSMRFEGDRTARWAADILLVRTDGTMHRVPFVLEDDAGDMTVPLQDAREVLLLVRNLDPEGRPARRYTWGAHFEPGYPVEFGALRAEPSGQGGSLVSWETGGERGVIGFNVLRSRGDSSRGTRINPVWIPAVGDTDAPAAYSFLDSGVQPGIVYRYRIEAVTVQGLASRSDAVTLSPAP